MADLWREDLHWLALSAHEDKVRDQARLAEIFLDRLSARAATITSHLGDDRWAGALSDGERQLRGRLEALQQQVTPAERASTAWGEVEVLLARLGMKKPG